MAYRLVTKVNSASPKNWLVISALLITLISSGCSAQVDFPVLTGSYLGQKPPGLIPQLFAPEIVSTERFGEAGGAFSKNGELFLFNRRPLQEEHKTIYCMVQRNGIWSKPLPVPFNSGFGDWSFDFGPDGQTLFFSSKRPVKPESGPSGNIWTVKLVGSEWTEPKNLGQPFCDSGISGVTHDGKYLFITNEKRKAGNDDIYCVDIRFIDLLKPDELK